MAAHAVEKTFGDRKVVKGASLYVRRGEAVGLLGPNGAGKTTIFYMMTGLISADKGHVEAMLRLGNLYREGRGMQADASLAETWLRRAAARGCLPALVGRRGIAHGNALRFLGEALPS